MKMKLMGILTVLMLAVVGCGGDAAGGAELADNNAPKFVVGTNATFPPFEYYDGTEIVGFDMELAGLIATELGRDLEIMDMEFNTLISAVNTGMVDAVFAGVTVTETRLVDADFSDGYFLTKQMIIVGADETEITGTDDLEGKTVGVQIGTTSAEFLQMHMEWEEIDIDIVMFNKSALAITDLLNGKIDAVIVDEEPAKNFVAGQSQLKLLDTPFVEEEYAVMLKKGDTQLQQDINTALVTLKSNGKYDELYNKYFDDAE